MKASVVVVSGAFWLGALALAGPARAGEHPAEHPQAGHEHPEGGKAGKAAAVTMGDLGKAIEEFARKDSALKGGGGYFLVYDPEAKRVLQLKLDRVHKNRLSRVSEGAYFARADFKAPEGKTYDLDIFMKGTSAASLTATEVSIHKEDGKDRCGWAEEGGIWKKTR